MHLYIMYIIFYIDQTTAMIRDGLKRSQNKQFMRLVQKLSKFVLIKYKIHIILIVYYYYASVILC